MTVAHSRVTNTYQVTSVRQASNHCLPIASPRQDFYGSSSARLGFNFRSRLRFTSYLLVDQSSLEGLESDASGFASTRIGLLSLYRHMEVKKAWQVRDGRRIQYLTLSIDTLSLGTVMTDRTANTEKMNIFALEKQNRIIEKLFVPLMSSY